MTTAVTSWRKAWHRWSTGLYGPSTRVSTLSWVGDERIAIGCLPTAATLYLLPGQGVTHIVNCRSLLQTRLSQDLALERAMLGSHRVVHAPMWDSGLPQPPALWSVAAVFAAEALADETSRVLIHCQQGRRRSAMVAYAVLRLRGHSP